MTVFDKLNAIAENESKVFQAGYGKGCYDLGHADGYSKGYDVGYHTGYPEGLNAGFDSGFSRGLTEGAINQHKEFWNSFQQGGTRTNYSYAFAGNGWNKATFKPIYPITPVGLAGHSIFRASGDIGDLEAILQGQGIYLDTSQAKTLELAFAQSGITRVGKIDTTNLDKLYHTFSNAQKLETIDELCLRKYLHLYQVFDNTFLNCYALKNITVTGKIYRDINLQWSTLLTPESMKSIISCLHDFSNSSSNRYKYSVIFADECWDALEADSKSPIDTTWREYVDSLKWLT